MKCPVCKSDKAATGTMILFDGKPFSKYICLSCGVHYSDVGEKDKPMEFQEWIETDEAFPVRKAFVRAEYGMYDIFKQIYKAGQKSVK